MRSFFTQGDILKGGVRAALCGKESSGAGSAEESRAHATVLGTSARVQHAGSFMGNNAYASEIPPPEAWTPVPLTAKDVLELDLAARLMSGTLSEPQGKGAKNTDRDARSVHSAVSNLYDIMSGVADRGVTVTLVYVCICMRGCKCTGVSTHDVHGTHTCSRCTQHTSSLCL